MDKVTTANEALWVIYLPKSKTFVASPRGGTCGLDFAWGFFSEEYAREESTRWNNARVGRRSSFRSAK